MAINVNIVFFQCQFLIQPLRTKTPHSSRPKHTTHSSFFLSFFLSASICSNAPSLIAVNASKWVRLPSKLHYFFFFFLPQRSCARSEEPGFWWRWRWSETPLPSELVSGKDLAPFFKIIFWNLIGFCFCIWMRISLFGRKLASLSSGQRIRRRSGKLASTVRGEKRKLFSLLFTLLFILFISILSGIIILLCPLPMTAWHVWFPSGIIINPHTGSLSMENSHTTHRVNVQPFIQIDSLHLKRIFLIGHCVVL